MIVAGQKNALGQTQQNQQKELTVLTIGAELCTSVELYTFKTQCANT